MNPPRSADTAVKAGRWAKAQHFAEAADLHMPTDDHDEPGAGDIYVTLAVHAGIAAADVICIGALGMYSATGAHEEAVDLVAKVDNGARASLARLLGVKTKAGYTHRPVSRSEVLAAQKALDRLMSVAREWA